MKSSARRRHAHMVGDPRRTPALMRAVAKAVRPGDRVVDIGTGLGVLAIAAAKAGAARVWAMDVDGPAIAHAMKAALREGVSERICFIQALSFDVKLPKRADVVLCEAVGSFGFDENILATLADAKRRLLKKNVRLVPSRLELWGAPIGRMPRMSEPVEIARVKPADLLGKPVRLASVKFSERIPKGVHAKKRFSIAKAGTARGIAVWPRATWFGRERSDASPLAPPTHWKQGILPLEARRVKGGERVGLELIVEPHPEDPFMMTERLWRWI